MEELKITRQTMLDSLHKGICKIVFTKKNGDERTMFGTLSEHHIPVTKTDAEGLKVIEVGKQKSKEAIAVWDLEKEDWRAFRIDSVKNWYDISKGA